MAIRSVREQPTGCAYLDFVPSLGRPHRRQHLSTQNGWIGVDLDGTIAEYDTWRGPTHIGAPIPAMIDRVKTWLANGIEVRIFTARIFPYSLKPDTPMAVTDDAEANAAFQVACTIADWCREHIGEVLPITCQKDYGMVELWDDRAVQIIPNTGRRADGRE